MDARRQADVAAPGDEQALPDQLEPPEQRSLTDDLEALYDDGRTFIQAELAFQKTRARFVSDKLKGGIGYALAAAVFMHIALLGLAVGLIISLATVLGPWLASAIVVVALLLAGVLLGLQAKKRFTRLADAFAKDDPHPDPRSRHNDGEDGDE